MIKDRVQGRDPNKRDGEVQINMEGKVGHEPSGEEWTGQNTEVDRSKQRQTVILGGMANPEPLGWQGNEEDERNERNERNELNDD